MKKITLLFCTALSFVSTCALAEGDTRFREHEWELSPFMTYVDKAGDQWGLGTSLTYFLTDRIGVGAATFWTGTGGTFIDNLAGEAYFRLPIFEALAPYAVGSFGYQFDSSEWFETLGGGLDFRFFDRIAAFSDIQYRFANKTRDGVFLRLGVRFAMGGK